jgi:hypothetical protein
VAERPVRSISILEFVMICTEDDCVHPLCSEMVAGLTEYLLMALMAVRISWCIELGSTCKVFAVGQKKAKLFLHFVTSTVIISSGRG